MLDSETKKRIDNLRNILVGKLPSPEGQVEQITTGLVYKFMHDMDEEAVEMGGVASFFVGDFEKYSWKHLFNPQLGGNERVKLYSEAIENMYTNPSAPQLFRDIFKNSFLPFKDPSTLNMFLKEIDEFQYSHSEKLGDAFEYLLSFMGSQGDAGQFRTPRHIIDFIVEIVNPQKDETILDPACGTCGFLISSYKHILTQNTGKRLGDKLTASERKAVGDNLVGYDISPDMTRISLVNMYLHQFSSPQIHEYDTLSSEDRWNEYYDVVLANPPFFSPTGGIQPHSRFGVKSTRAEVLFVDYIISHLKPNGRAGIIVPEGIIFQNGKAYKELRKKLVEDSLVGVISLPSGVFQPYSGVKTSILILDKQLHKKTDSVFFTKVENDGFSLGTKRTPISKNDLPLILNLIQSIQKKKATNHPIISLAKRNSILEQESSPLTVKIKKVEKSSKSAFIFESIKGLCEIQNGYAFKSSDYVSSGYRIIRITNVKNGLIEDSDPKFHNRIGDKEHDKFSLFGGDILISLTGNVGRVARFRKDFEPAYLNQRVCKIESLVPILSKDYLFWILNSHYFETACIENSTGVAQKNLSTNWIYDFQIPVPPLEIQQEIVDEIEGYQKIIDGCRQVVQNYKPTIDIDPSWEMVELGELIELKGGKRLPKGKQFSEKPTQYPYIRVSDFKNFSIDTSNLKFITKEIHEKIARYIITSDDLYISIAGTIGLVGGIPKELSGANLTENAAKIILNTNDIEKEFLVFLFATELIQNQIKSRTHAVGVPKLALERIRTIKIPVPSVNMQNQIISSIKKQTEIVDGNKTLIDIYTKKIQDRMAKVWGEA